MNRKNGTNPTPSKRTIGYVRCSTQGQVRDGESLERQVEQIRAYCHRKCLENVEIIEDAGLSGFKDNRPGFQRLLQLCRSGQVNSVVIYDLSRLSRSVRTTLAFIEDTIGKNGIEFVSIQNDIDTSTPMGRAFLGITAIFNQIFRDEISHKTKLALAHKRTKSEKTGGHVPFGFTVQHGSLLVANDSEMGTIEKIRQLRSSGNSLREIAAELELNEIKTKTGKSSWTAKVIRDLLRRPLPSRDVSATSVTDAGHVTHRTNGNKNEER